MLGISIMARKVHRWARDDVKGDARGNAVASFTEMGSHLMTIYPLSSSREQTAQGFGTDDFYGATSYSTEYAVGDGVGTSEKKIYDVMECSTYSTHQELVLKKVA